MENNHNFDEWIGREESLHDVVDPRKMAALAATLNCEYRAEAGAILPPGWHWIYFNPIVPMSEVRHDGHAKKGAFLPPIDLPRRMWAGGRLDFDQPLVVGESIERVSTIKDISFKSGKSGNLAFVTVRHDIKGDKGGHVIEEQDIVYREAAKPAGQQPQAPSSPDQEPYDWSEKITPDSVLLFRYSALTFNGHRIHYDREFCVAEEGYPGLVVHGPLTATLLLELARQHCPETPVKHFRFRALRPLFDTDPFLIRGRKEGNTIRLWALDPNQQRAIDASADI